MTTHSTQANGGTVRHASDIPQQVSRRRSPIVVGADDSYWGRRALRWAADHAWAIGAELEAHVPPIDARATARGGWIGDTLSAFPVAPNLIPSDADPVTVLLRASQHAALVVLGSRGNRHHGIGLGATVLPVATGADCDVMVIGGRPRAVAGSYQWITVMVGEGTDEHALRSAAGLAVLRRVPLRIVLPVPIIGPHPLKPPIDPCMAALERAAQLVHRVAPTVHTTAKLVWTTPHETVATLTDTDVLVIGVRGQVSPIARAALYQAASPVLIARAAQPAPADRQPTSAGTSLTSSAYQA